MGAFCVLKLDELNLFSIKEQSFVYGMKFQLVGHWQFVLHGLLCWIPSFWTLWQDYQVQEKRFEMVFGMKRQDAVKFWWESFVDAEKNFIFLN